MSPSTLRLPTYELADLLAADPDHAVYPTTADSPAFWLYTSGTTGSPKAAMHRHGAIQVVCETYGTQVLGITADDRCLSAAKAFFAYGLGNSVLFPLSVGAAAVLEPGASKPDVIAARAREHGATLFFAGPTFFANMLRAELPATRSGRFGWPRRRVRRCRRRSTGGGPVISASTSSTASG